MAFCNSCGTPSVDGARFCAKCGAAVAAGTVTPVIAAASSSPAPLSAAPAQSSSTLKIVLTILGVLLLLFILGTSAVLFVGWRIARQVHVEKNGDNVRVVSPFGNVDSTNSADDIVRELGTAVYPGSTIQKENSSSVAIAGMHTITAEFETSDPPSKVGEFYKQKFPEANVSVASDDHYTIVTSSIHPLVTISVEPDGGRTRIHITSVSGTR